MKIAFSTTGDKIDAPLDPRFGRTKKFLIYDTEKETFEIIDNEMNLNAAQGAGIQAAKNVAPTGATAIVTGNCGPKAFRVLTQAKISVYKADSKTVKDALALFLDNKLSILDEANAEMHQI